MQGQVPPLCACPEPPHAPCAADIARALQVFFQMTISAQNRDLNKGLQHQE